ncbi:hypothetical protein GR160_02795 [Flavobacterium sp. Sd200]|uniref:hypothetical protein n=1 Tax=Flavobacterium sp. Sd200 TaxID=2692211 RepID=UPI00136E4CAA|nr:hypothetical protein [Flavobacterium sp. Sd200]MXN90141.1 hypothetical protein [Flavobacterium sp. Sd200]
MGLGTKILIGAGILVYIYRSNFFTNTQCEVCRCWPNTSPYIGYAVTSPATVSVYKINEYGYKVQYENWDAWINDGEPELLSLLPEELSAISTLTTAKIFEIGGYRTL